MGGRLLLERARAEGSENEEIGTVVVAARKMEELSDGLSDVETTSTNGTGSDSSTLSSASLSTQEEKADRDDTYPQVEYHKSIAALAASLTWTSGGSSDQKHLGDPIILQREQRLGRFDNGEWVPNGDVNGEAGVYAADEDFVCASDKSEGTREDGEPRLSLLSESADEQSQSEEGIHRGGAEGEYRRDLLFYYPLPPTSLLPLAPPPSPPLRLLPSRCRCATPARRRALRQRQRLSTGFFLHKSH